MKEFRYTVENTFNTHPQELTSAKAKVFLMEFNLMESWAKFWIIFTDIWKWFRIRKYNFGNIYRNNSRRNVCLKIEIHLIHLRSIKAIKNPFHYRGSILLAHPSHRDWSILCRQEALVKQAIWEHQKAMIL